MVGWHHRHEFERAPGVGDRQGNNGNSERLYFEELQKSLQMVTAAMKLKDAYSLEGKL